MLVTGFKNDAEKERVFDLFTECLVELEMLNIKFQTIDTLKCNNRLKSVWGKCKRQYIDNKAHFTIELSKTLLKANENAIKDTIIHEILHTVDKCFNHGKEWQEYAKKVNMAYNHNIKTATSYSEKGLEKPADNFSYFIGCPKCGMKWGYKTLAYAVKNPSIYICGKCNKSLVRL